MLESISKVLAVVDLTPTDGVMIVCGTVLIFILHRVMANKVFAPLLEHLEQRESLTTGALFTAGQMRQKAQALRARFDEALFRARVEGNTKKASIVSAAKDQASKIIRDVEAEVAAQVQSGREEISKQISNASASAEREASDLAQRLASQVDTQLGAH